MKHVSTGYMNGRFLVNWWSFSVPFSAPSRKSPYPVAMVGLVSRDDSAPALTLEITRGWGEAWECRHFYQTQL